MGLWSVFFPLCVLAHPAFEHSVLASQLFLFHGIINNALVKAECGPYYKIYFCVFSEESKDTDLLLCLRQKWRP